MSKAIISATSAICAIGGGVDQIWASARAGISRIASSNVMDKHFEAVQMGLVPEDQLPPLPPEIEKGLPARARRLLRLAAPTFAAVAQTVKPPVRVVIGLPELNIEQAP